MPRYIALLRGINVGGHNVKMDALRSLFEELGLEQVTTFIASGNVIFDSKVRNTAKLERLIETHLLAALGYAVPTFIRSAAELKLAASYQPFSGMDLNAEGASLYIVFLKTPLSDVVQNNVLDLRTETDEFAVQGREVYWFCRTKISESPLFKGDRLGKALGATSTSRNSTTVKKLTELDP